MPEGTSLDLTIDYIAGFFDGEGCISISPRKGPRVIVTNTNLEMVEAIQQFFGGTGVVNVKHRTAKDGATRACYYLVWWNRHAEAVLKVLTPHLIMKRQEALLAQEYMTLMPTRQAYCGSRKGLAPEVWERRFAIAAECTRLKGVSSCG